MLHKTKKIDFPLLCKLIESYENSCCISSISCLTPVNYWAVLNPLYSVVLTGSREFCEISMKRCVCHMLMGFIAWRNTKPWRNVLGGGETSSSLSQLVGRRKSAMVHVILPMFELLQLHVCMKCVLSLSRWLPAAFGNHRCNVCDTFQFPISRSLWAAPAMPEWQLLRWDKGLDQPWQGNATLDYCWWIHKPFPTHFILLSGFCWQSGTYKG